MNSCENHYLRINHKNSLKILSGDEIAKLTLSIFTTIASVQEDKIGNELNKYFNKIIPNNNSDLYDINVMYSNQYYTNHEFDDEQLNYSVNNVLKTDYSSTFLFNQTNTEDVMRILVLCFRKLKINQNYYQITNNNDMLQRIQLAIESNYDAVKLFIDTQTISPLESFSMRSGSFVSKSSNLTGEDHNQIKVKSTICSTKTGMSSKEIQYVSMKNIFTYPNSNKKKKFKDIIPIEMLILLNKFQTIKKVSFTIDQITDKQFAEIILILLNSKWLFSNLLEIDFDLTNNEMRQEIENIFNEKLSHKSRKTTMYDSTASSQFTWLPNQELEDDYKDSSFNVWDSPQKKYHRSQTVSVCKDKQYDKSSSIEYFKQKKKQIEIIIIYSHFISKVNQLKSLSLNFQDSFSMEIEELLLLSNIYLVDFHFLTFISELTQLSELRLNFNSLDIYNFQKVLGIINNNEQLLNLRLSLFTSDDSYTPVALFKLCKRLKMNITDIFDEKILSIGDNNYENCEIDHLIVNKLLNCFEDNLEKLFHVFFSYLKIQELVLFLALPKIIANNEAYIMVLIKFVLNILFLLSNERICFKVFNLISPLLWFNTRKYPFIEGCLDEVNLEGNTSSLRSLTIQLRFDNVLHISKMISTQLEYLFLGDFDHETFNNFIQFYTSSNFIKNSQLNSLTISLSKKIVNYSNAKNGIHKYFLSKPKGLTEQNMISFIQINTPNETKDIVNLIYIFNKVEINNIELCEGKHIIIQDLIDEYLDIPKYIMYAFAKLNKRNIVNENIFRRIRGFLFLNKNNPFKIKD